MAQLKLRMALERRVVSRKAEREAQEASATKIPSGGGAALDGGLRKKMESQLGADLSGARIHTGGESAAAARSFGARAFTVGNDVHFNAGEFKPGTKEGDRLIAHELTHVVQGQNSAPAVARKEGGEKDAAEAESAAGEQKGGSEALEVSQPGDAAEQEADHVADHAVENMHGDGEAKGHGAEAKGEGADAEGKEDEGESKDGEKAGAGAKTAKPAKKQEKPKIAAKLDGVGRKIYRLAGSTQGVTVQQGLPGAGGSYQGALDAQAQAGGFQRDANLNNADKVALEGELAGAIMRNLNTFGEVVYRVSKNISQYIKVRDKEVQAEMLKTIEQMVGEPPYYGRMGDKPGELGPVYAAQLQQFLETGAGPIPQHIGAHGQFLTRIYANDISIVKEQGKTVVRGKGKEILDNKMAGFTGQTQALDPKGLKDKEATVSLNGTQDANGQQLTAQPFKDRGRTEVNPNAASVSTMQGIAPAGQGNVNVGEGNAQSHQRGTDVWQTQETNLFIQHARLVLDMPMSGGGISGTTAELMQCARIMGVSDSGDLTKYGLACFAHLGSAGAHSFHEVMSVVALAGGQYTPGDYKGALAMVPDSEKARLLADPRFGPILGAPPAPNANPQQQQGGSTTAGGGGGGGGT
jgi:hypothetical protein